MGNFFIVIGALTSYLDLLTYPIVTLGVPLTLWLSLNTKSQVLHNVKNLFLFSLLWVIGYGGMWTGKWIIGSVITRENIIQNALQSIHFRTSSIVYGREVSFRNVIESVMNISWKYVSCAWIIIIVLLIYKKITVKKWEFKHYIEYVVIGLLPFVWYFILKNHSYIHCWFTYREMTITIFALMTGCVKNR